MGRVNKGKINHSVGKLENGRYAVGYLVPGQTVKIAAQFETLDAAFDHWLATLPMHAEPLRRECGIEHEAQP